MKLQRFAVLVVAGALVLALAGCPQKAPEDTAGAPSGVPPSGAGGAVAPDAEPPADEPTQAALTPDDVKQVMECMADDEVDGIMEEILAGVEVEDKDSPEAITAALDAAAGNAALDEAVKKHGFADAADLADKTKRVLPGLTIALTKVLAEMMGIEEGSKEYNEMMEDDEFAAFREAFGEPSEEDLAVIIEGVRAQMEEQGGAKKVEEPQ